MTAPARDWLWPDGSRPPCNEPGCEDPVYLAGRCGPHYAEDGRAARHEENDDATANPG